MALSDPAGILASPFTIIDRTNEQQDIEAIIAIARENEVGRIIAGLPLSMNGSVGPQAEKVKSFVQSLSENTDVPVDLRDERLSTVAAKRLMQSAGGRKKKPARDDAAAAAIILQGYLEETEYDR